MYRSLVRRALGAEFENVVDEVNEREGHEFEIHTPRFDLQSIQHNREHIITPK